MSGAEKSGAGMSAAAPCTALPYPHPTAAIPAHRSPA